uniref:Organic solute transporter subunit alpha isoform X2 n=1 Tax=Phascolarctos cinereus TaxID=38626 RepID=A0A6P5K9N2_PHACI|nr:organic solute transporter subunit alpha isoform X2 [Phascolarctos cinereus]
MEPSSTLRLPPSLFEVLTINYSVPVECLSHPPTAAQLLTKLNSVELTILVILTLFTVGSVIIYVEDAIYLYKNTRCPIKRKTLIWSSSAPTVVSIFGCCGLWIPRALMFVEMAITTYFAICFYLILMVMVEGFGGKEAVLRTLKDTPMIVHTGPCCCCCLCCPRFTLTKRKLQLLMLAPFQYAFLKMVFVLLGLLLVPDGIYDPALLLVVLTALQPAIFSILASIGQIACSPPFSSKIRSQVMNCHFLVVQTSLLTVMTRIFYRKRDDKMGFEPFSFLEPSSEPEA